jgi:hypothetical protein
MKHAKPLAGLLALLASLAIGNASAQQAQTSAQTAREQGAPQAQEEQAGNAGQPQGKATDQARRRQAAQPTPRRRAVPAIIGSMPQPSAPQAYGPVLNPAAPQTPMPAPAPAGLPPSAPINNCMGGQCTDAAGNTYNTGVGNAALDSKGRLCNRTGMNMQCF